MEWLSRFIRTRWAWALVLQPLVFFLAFFVGPLLYLFFVSLHEVSQAEMYGTQLTVNNYVRIAGDPFYLFIIRRTLTAGLAVSGLSLLIGYPVALSMVRMSPSRRSLLLMVLLFPLMVSNVIRAYGWIAILGRRGVINNALGGVGLIQAPLSLMYSLETVVVGLLTILLPYMIICLVNALLTVDRNLEEAAQALGAGPGRTFLHVTLPLSTPLQLDQCQTESVSLLGEYGQALHLGVEAAPAVGIRLGARYVGLADRLLDMAVTYAKSWTALGALLQERPAVQRMLAELKVEIESVRWLVYHAAWLTDKEGPARLLAAEIRLAAGQMLSNATHLATMIYGGPGPPSEQVEMLRYVQSAIPMEAHEYGLDSARLVIAHEILNAANGD